MRLTFRLSAALSITVLDKRFNTTVQEYVEVIRDLPRRSRVARIKEIGRIKSEH